MLLAHAVILPPAIQLSDHPTILPSNYPTIQLSDHLIAQGVTRPPHRLPILPSDLFPLPLYLPHTQVLTLLMYSLPPTPHSLPPTPTHAQVLTLLMYSGALVALSSPLLLDATFDLQFILTVEFAWRVALLTAASTVPVWIGKVTTHYCAPRVAEKVRMG